MRLNYDRRFFWILTGVSALFLAGSLASGPLAAGESWRSAFWLQERAGLILPLFAGLLLLTVLIPTLALFLDARKRSRGIPVTLSPKLQAHRARHWSSPLPWPVWAILGSWCLLLVLAWTDALPRILFGYRGTLGRGMRVAWCQEISPDGRRLAMEAELTGGGAPHTLAVVDRGNGKTATYSVPDYIQSISWSPDSRWAAVGGQDFLEILDFSPGRTIHLKRPGLASFSFHPDGNLWTLAEDGLWLWNPKTRASTRLLEKQATFLGSASRHYTPLCMAISPSGKLLALHYGQYIRILEASQLGQIAFWETPRNSGKEIRFATDDRLLLASSPADERAFSLLLLDAAQGKVVSRIDRVQWDSKTLEHVDVSRDGRWLVTLRVDHCVAVWSLETQRWVWSAPQPTGTGEKAPRFSPGGQEITTVGRSDPSLLLTRGSPVRRWRWHS